MSDSEIKESDELINEVQSYLWSDRNEHLSISDLTKKDGLVKLFREIEQILVENADDWYVQPSIEIDKSREKSQLYSDFASHLFRESDRKKFADNPKVYYNDNSKLPRWEFWAATCKALGLAITRHIFDEKDPTTSVLHHELIEVDWEDLIETHGSKNDEYHLNLGGKYPVMKLWIPKYQRPRRWNIAKSIMFSESLRTGYPIPPLFVYNDEENNRYHVLDGQQRIHALIDTKIDWQGRVPLKSKACVFVISSNTEADKKDVRKALVSLYQRLNTGGVNLKPIEVLIGVHEDKPLLSELIVFAREIFSAADDEGGWKSHMSSIFTPKRGGQNLLDTEENHLRAHELDLLDTLFRPLVYGTIDEANEGPKFTGLSTMKGIEQLLSHTYSRQECELIIDRLDNAFTAAYSAFGIEGCFLRMAKGRDESGKILWQPSTRVDKTATALQVGTFFSTMKPRAVLGESEIKSLSSRWIEFMNSTEGFDQTGYLDDRGQPGRQNSGSLWSWQITWLEAVKPQTEHLEEQIPEVFTQINSRYSREEILRWLKDPGQE
jgi:hypothetical protein